jgi:hypothetical protein
MINRAAPPPPPSPTPTSIPTARPPSPTPTSIPSAGVDPNLIGTWGLVVAGTKISSGVLTIDMSGSYRWVKSEGTFTGTLSAYTPPRGAQSGVRYYRISDSRYAYYIFFTTYHNQSYMQVNFVSTDLIVAQGYLQ